MNKITTSPAVKKIRWQHLAIGIPLFILFAALDIHFTLLGTNGNLALEGNIWLRSTMQNHGPFNAMLIHKSIVLLVCILFSLITTYGIENEKDWVYWLAFMPMSKRWMRKKKRYFMAYMPLHLVTAAQAFAAISWIYLLNL